MTHTEKLVLARGLIRAFNALRNRYTRDVPVTLDGREYRAEVDHSGNINVFNAHGGWLGWVNASGEPQSMGGIEPGLPTLCVAVASRATFDSQGLRRTL